MATILNLSANFDPECGFITYYKSCTFCVKFECFTYEKEYHFFFRFEKGFYVWNKGGGAIIIAIVISTKKIRQ